MKVYVVYESYYGELVLETGDCTDILGVYTDLEKVKEKVNNIVQSDLADNYVLDDNEKNAIDENGGCYRLFWNNQENWQCYYEIVAELKEVE